MVWGKAASREQSLMETLLGNEGRGIIGQRGPRRIIRFRWANRRPQTMNLS